MVPWWCCRMQRQDQIYQPPADTSLSQVAVIFIMILILEFCERESKCEQDINRNQSQQQYYSRINTRTESLQWNARSLIVNCHGEPVTTDMAVPTKRFFSQSTHSRFLEVLSESIIFAAQGLCEGTPVVSRSCRCSEQIGCISHWFSNFRKQFCFPRKIPKHS